MTVKDLIQELEHADPTALVVSYDPEWGDYNKVDSVYQTLVVDSDSWGDGNRPTEKWKVQIF